MIFFCIVKFFRNLLDIIREMKSSYIGIVYASYLKIFECVGSLWMYVDAVDFLLWKKKFFFLLKIIFTKSIIAVIHEEHTICNEIFTEFNDFCSRPELRSHFNFDHHCFSVSDQYFSIIYVVYHIYLLWIEFFEFEMKDIGIFNQIVLVYTLWIVEWITFLTTLCLIFRISSYKFLLLS